MGDKGGGMGWDGGKFPPKLMRVADGAGSFAAAAAASYSCLLEEEEDGFTGRDASAAGGGGGVTKNGSAFNLHAHRQCGQLKLGS